MRQAGRYLSEYRAVRERLGFLALCKSPDAAAEVTVTAALRLGVDAAIIFADILLVLEPMGVGLEFSRGDGPVIHRPVRSGADVDRLLPVHPAALAYVMEAVRRARAALPAHLPLIGFAGAPFTLASYLIEGGGSRTYARTKTIMLGDPGAWRALMERLSASIAAYLNAQIAAGAEDPRPNCRHSRPGRRTARAHLQPGARHPAPDPGRSRPRAGRRGARALGRLGSMTATADAVLLIAFGGPTRSEEIRPFLANVVRGREHRIPAERIEEVVHHYEMIGGRSPLNEITLRQAARLETALATDGPPLPVFVGMRDWAPYLADTLARMTEAGLRQVVG